MHRLLITGSSGLIGWHAASRAHAMVASDRFHGSPQRVSLATAVRADIERPEELETKVDSCDAVLHFAGANRGPDADVEATNVSLAERLVEALQRSGSAPTIVYANSTHRTRDTAYGRSKREAARLLRSWAKSANARFVDLVIPHVFGEYARPHYNNVTATFIQHVLDGTRPHVDPDGAVELVHAGDVAARAIEAAVANVDGDIELQGHRLAVTDLIARLADMHTAYEGGVFPDLREVFDRDLFNAYRIARGPDGWRRALTKHTDHRGFLVETVKGGGGGQSFASRTEPGITRGQHFHLRKVERFVVLEGDAIIRLRRVLHEPVVEYRVTGEDPVAIDIPVLNTHNMENVGSTPLVTLFWTHELFDPNDTDTYADEV